MKYTEGETKSISMDIYPNGTAAKMRFGIMVKYVDATHWAYLNYDVGSWLLEYNNGSSSSSYPSVSGLTTLTDNQDTNVTINYTAAGTLEVVMTPEGGDAYTATIDDSASGFGNILSALDTYAAENDMTVRFGFKAGTYTKDGVSNLTDVNLKNMTLNDASIMEDEWSWVVEREGQVFDKDDIIGGTDYVVLTTSDNIDTTLTDFENGTVSMDILPVSDNIGLEIGVKYVSDSTTGTTAGIAYDEEKWYSAVVGSDSTERNECNGPVLAKDTEYTLTITIAEGKMSAAVTAGETVTTLAEDIDVSALPAGSIAMSGTGVYIKNLDYTKITKSSPEALESRYEELKDLNNDDNRYYSDTWAAFVEARDAAKAMIDSDDEITPAEATAVLNTLNSKYNNLAEVNKTALTARYDALKDTENNNYTDESWAAFTEALEAAKAVIDKASVTKAEVTSALGTLNTAYNRLAEKTVSAEEKAELTGYYENVKALESKDYTEATWAAYAEALAEVEAVIAKGDAATQAEAKAALAKLQAAFAALESSATVAFAQAAYTVDATATVETKVVTNAAVTYTTSDASVATVDAKGVVTGIKAGTATITATAGSVSATATVTVTVPKVTLTATSTKMQVKKSTKAIQVEEKLDTDSVVSWTSSNKNVATVNKAGKIKAKKTGSTVITVTMKSGATASCKLKVQKGKVVTKSIKVASTKVTLNAGETYTIKAKRNPITATEKITYKASKSKVASVSKKGVIKAKKAGTCKITIKCNGKKKVVTVTVK